MTQAIIYKQNNGVLAVIIPAPEALERYGIDAIALKDVPEGKPFKIIAASDLPQDKSLRHLWTADDADLDDGVGAEWDVFPNQMGENGGPNL